MGLIAAMAFWGMVIQLYRAFGPKPPALFLSGWAVGFFGFPIWSIDANYFIAYQAVLVIFMILYGKVKNMGL